MQILETLEYKDSIPIMESRKIYVNGRRISFSKYQDLIFGKRLDTFNGGNFKILPNGNQKFYFYKTLRD